MKWIPNLIDFETLWILKIFSTIILLIIHVHLWQDDWVAEYVSRGRFTYMTRHALLEIKKKTNINKWHLKIVSRHHGFYLKFFCGFIIIHNITRFTHVDNSIDQECYALSLLLLLRPQYDEETYIIHKLM